MAPRTSSSDAKVDGFGAHGWPGKTFVILCWIGAGFAAIGAGLAFPSMVDGQTRVEGILTMGAALSTLLLLCTVSYGIIQFTKWAWFAAVIIQALSIWSVPVTLTDPEGSTSLKVMTLFLWLPLSIAIIRYFWRRKASFGVALRFPARMKYLR